MMLRSKFEVNSLLLTSVKDGNGNGNGNRKSEMEMEIGNGNRKWKLEMVAKMLHDGHSSRT